MEGVLRLTALWRLSGSGVMLARWVVRMEADSQLTDQPSISGSKRGPASHSKGHDMIRTLASLALIAAFAASPAFAAPATQSTMPVIRAIASDTVVNVRVSKGVVGHTRRSMYRTVTVEAFDNQNRSLGTSTVSVSKRLSYASVPLTADMKSASKLTVSAQ
jgi:hypothetical protein